MKCFCLFVFCILSFAVSADVLMHSNADIEDKLIAAHVIYRHGARNIDFVFPNDPYKDEIHWPEGIGQLTKQGKVQQYELGKYLRQRYETLLGADGKYSPNKVYIRSTDVDRTLMSAEANSAGLFFPTEDEKWNNNILWQPIAIHTVPKDLDYVLYSIVDCPKFEALRSIYLNESKEVQRIFTKYASIFSFLSRMTGANITTMYDVYKVWDTLKLENSHNKTLPDWAKDVIKPGSIEEYISTYDFKTYTDTPQMARLISGFLFKEILQHFFGKIDKTLKPNRSLWIYSAHDFTITNMLNALGLYELHIPPFASSLHFELFQTFKNQQYVNKCPLQKVYEIYNGIIPGDFSTECRLN